MFGIHCSLTRLRFGAVWNSIFFSLRARVMSSSSPVFVGASFTSATPLNHLSVEQKMLHQMRIRFAVVVFLALYWSFCVEIRFASVLRMTVASGQWQPFAMYWAHICTMSLKRAQFNRTHRKFRGVAYTKHFPKFPAHTHHRSAAGNQWEFISAPQFYNTPYCIVTVLKTLLNTFDSTHSVCRQCWNDGCN